MAQDKWVDVPDPYKQKTGEEGNWVDIPDPTDTPFTDQGPPVPQQITEPTDYWGGLGKALLPQNLLSPKGGAGWLHGAILDLPGNVWELAKTVGSLTPPGIAYKYLTEGVTPTDTLTKIGKGFGELPGHIAKTTEMAGSEPYAFGRMMGQLTGQPAVTEGLMGNIPGVPSGIQAAKPIIRAVGRPVEFAGKIGREYAPVTRSVPPILRPPILKDIERGIGGFIERRGQKMQQVGIDQNTIPLEEFWGRNTPQNSITRVHGQTVIDPSDPFSRTPTSTAVLDADALKDFYGGPKGVPIEPEGININTESDPMSRAPFAQSDVEALQDFYGGDKPPLRTPPPTTVGDFSDPFSRTPITPSETVTPPEGMVSMEGRGSIDVQQGAPVTETPVTQPAPVTPQAPPKLIPSRNLTPEQKAALIEQGYTPIVQKGVPYFQEPKLAGQPALTSVEPSPARPGAHEPLPQDTSVEDLTGALQNELNPPSTPNPMPESMWEQAKRLARDESGELDIEVFQKAYERLKKGFGLKPGEIGGRVAQFASKEGDQFGPQPEILPPDKWDYPGEIPPGFTAEEASAIYEQTRKPSVPTRPDSPPFPESEIEANDIATQSGGEPFKWNEGPPAPDMTEPGLPFGPMELRKQTQLDKIGDAPKNYNEGGYPWDEPMQQSIDFEPSNRFDNEWYPFYNQRELPLGFPNDVRLFHPSKELSGQFLSTGSKRPIPGLQTELQGRLSYGRQRPSIDKEFYESIAKNFTEKPTSLSHGFASGELADIPKGEPGLTIQKDYPEDISGWNGYQVTYRDNAGKAIATASIHKTPKEGVRVGIFAADKTRGALYGDAVLEMLYAFKKLGVTGSAGSYSSHVAEMIKHLGKYVKED